MVGVLQFERHGEPVEATLTDQGLWLCDDADALKALQTLFNVQDRPYHGSLGTKALGDAAEHFEAVLTLEPVEAVPGRVY